MSGVKLTQEARLDIRRDAERSCVGASVGDTLRLLDDYDALAQRCRDWELNHALLRDELENERMAVAAFRKERDALRAEVERLQSEMEDLMFALADAEHRAENAGRNASAFEDRMGDLQVENGKLRAEVDRLDRITRHLVRTYIVCDDAYDPEAETDRAISRIRVRFSAT